MKIITTYRSSGSYSITGMILYERADLLNSNSELLMASLNRIGVTAVLSRDKDFLNKIRKHMNQAPTGTLRYLLLLTDMEQHLPGIHVITQIDPVLQEIRALQYLEDVHASMVQVPLPTSQGAKSRIVLVGAGVVNLVTALSLVENGYKVSVLSNNPRPETNEHWKLHGCTFGGSDARIFSFNESRQHHYRGTPFEEILNDQYRKTIEDGGWLCCSTSSLREEDLEWIREFEAYPQWMFEKIQQEIIQFNRESYEDWKRIITNYPLLFTNTGFVNRLFRIYETEPLLNKGRVAEKEIGSFIRDLEQSDYEELLTCSRELLTDGRISGGLEVNGFGINIHKFSRQLILMLEKMGVEFNWDEQVQRIDYTSTNQVDALITSKRVIKAQYVVVSPGVANGNFLKRTASFGQIGAMMGCWLTLPNNEVQLKYPIKVARSGFASQEAAAGANIVPGTADDGSPVIHISSGHGFIGLNPHNINHGHLNSLSLAVHETAKRMFPRAYESCVRRGLFSVEPRYCIRPWTPSCLGLFEIKPTAGGGLFIVTGGHNTGGFAQSPVIAQAVLDAIEGRCNQMHYKYHPDRLREFFNFVPYRNQFLFNH